MKLKNIELIPGIVVDNADPQKIGRVKAAVPGIFDTTTMSMESLPWIYPISMGGHQRFSKPELSDKIWLVINWENYHEYWYLYLPEYHEDANSIKDQYDGTEVIFSRASGSGNKDMYYNHHDGVVSNCCGNQWQLEPNGNSHFIGCDNSVGVWNQEGKSYIGDSNIGEHQPAIFGDNLYELLSNLANALTQTSSAASGFWATSHLATPLMDCAKAITDSIDKIRTNFAFVN